MKRGEAVAEEKTSRVVFFLRSPRSHFTAFCINVLPLVDDRGYKERERVVEARDTFTRCCSWMIFSPSSPGKTSFRLSPASIRLAPPSLQQEKHNKALSLMMSPSPPYFVDVSPGIGVEADARVCYPIPSSLMSFVSLGGIKKTRGLNKEETAPCQYSPPISNEPSSALCKYESFLGVAGIVQSQSKLFSCCYANAQGILSLLHWRKAF